MLNLAINLGIKGKPEMSSVSHMSKNKPRERRSSPL